MTRAVAFVLCALLVATVAHANIDSGDQRALNPSDPTSPTSSATTPTSTTLKPTEQPTKPTEQPTKPTEQPTKPTEQPTKPTEQPTKPTNAPPTASPAPTTPDHITKVDPYVEVHNLTFINTTGMPSSEPTCLPTIKKSDTPPKVAIITGDGASEYSTQVLYQTALAVGATPQLVCITTNPDAEKNNRVVLVTKVVKPSMTLACDETYLSTDNTTKPDLSSYDVVAVAHGYAATSELRLMTTVTDAIKKVADDATLARKLTMLLHGSGTEVIIPFLNASTATDSIAGTLAVQTANQHFRPPTKVVTPPNASSYSNFVNNNTQAVLGENEASTPTFLIAAAKMLGLTYQGPSVNCTNGTKYTPITTKPFAAISEEEFTALPGNAHSEFVNTTGSGIHKKCVNSANVNFCTDMSVAILAAHGTHDVELISMYQTMDRLSSSGVKIVCADDAAVLQNPQNASETRPAVYLQTMPATKVSFRLYCDSTIANLNVANVDLVLVPGGVVATNGYLRNSLNTISELRVAKGLGIFGTANTVLMKSGIALEDMKAVRTPYTNEDLQNANMTLLPEDTEPEDNRANKVQLSPDMRSQVFAGFGLDNVTMNMQVFLEESVAIRVLQNSKHKNLDMFVVGAWTGAGILLALVVGGTIAYRFRRSATEEDEPLV